VIARAERLAVRRLLTARGFAKHEPSDRESADDIDGESVHDVLLAKRILDGIRGARSSDPSDLTKLARLYAELQRMNNRDGMVCGREDSRPFDESIRLASTNVGLPIEEVLGYPEPIKKYLCELVA
jgi:hypothetical protein